MSKNEVRSSKSKRRGKPYPQAQVVHFESHISLLDKDAPPVNYNGLVNFFLLLFGGMMVRLILENYLKYGILVTLPGFNFNSSDLLFSLTCIVLFVLNVLFSFFVEKNAAEKSRILAENATVGKSKKPNSEKVPEKKPEDPKKNSSNSTIVNLKSDVQEDALKRKADQAVHEKAFFDLDDSDKKKFNTLIYDDSINLLLQFSNIFVALVFPSVMVFYLFANPLLGTAIMSISVVLSLKLYSYTATNLDLRRAYVSHDVDFNKDLLLETTFSKDHILSINTAAQTNVYVGMPIKYDVNYPDNIKLWNLLYFLVVPTLCYQPSYPKPTHKMRISFILRRLVEIFFLSALMYIVILQYAYPTLVNSVTAIESLNQAWVSERVLKLSVAVSLLWLIGFYLFFHSTLNLVAELTGFTDRLFYLDWWNSSDLGSYWRLWNLPIHNFCKRHIMIPLTSPPFNLNSFVGGSITFFISAVLHELVFGLPTKSTRLYAFFGMILQIPLVSITQYVSYRRGSKSQIGNALFWISFCIIGQPLLVLLYYYDWIKLNKSIIPA
ncbi:Diacylglycerol O-acyltransferase 1 [Smittium mucronatum]|uniref:O-acyltransferase n=1 Tax=Smittium mucronatum TaxID=133383 RepID=A0A1R0H816_9FUNG|nr:Diacylglycerol O-acyltransferase 1 [Smittium mucronatum]